MFWLTKANTFFSADFRFKKKKVILCISVLSHSSISGGGEKVGKREAVFHPGLKHPLTSLVILIYVTAPVAAVSGLLVLLENSQAVEKWKIHYALGRNGFFFMSSYQLGLREGFWLNPFHQFKTLSTWRWSGEAERGKPCFEHQV